MNEKTSLKDRRVRGDLIQMFKIMKGLEVVKWEKRLEHEMKQFAKP